MTPLPKMRPRDVDMSPEAIDQRLRDVSDLTQLCLSLGTAKRLGTVKEIRERERLAELEEAARTVGPPAGAIADEQGATTVEHKDNL